MKFIGLLLVGHIVLVHSSPILSTGDGSMPTIPAKSHAKATTVTKVTPEGTTSAASAEASARLFRREEPAPASICPKPDYKNIQERVTLALEKAVEKLMKDQFRKKRSAVAKASSEVGTGGKASSSASAMNTPDASIPVAPVNPKPEGLPGMNMDLPSANIASPGEYPVNTFFKGGKHPGNMNMASGKVEDLEPVHPAAPAPAAPADSTPVVPPAAVVPAPGTPVVPPTSKHSKIQNVKATANMETGTAIATASKRAVGVQNVAASADKAIASAKTKSSNANGATIQKVEANGGQLAVASAESGAEEPIPINKAIQRVKRDNTVQKVSAKGNKAIATAQNHKAGDMSLQNVAAEGGDLAVATANSDGSEPVPLAGSAPVLPAPAALPETLPEQPKLPEQAHNLASGPKTRATDTSVQIVKSQGNKAISSAKSKSDGVTALQDVESVGNELAVATATHSKRSCDLLNFDDSIRSLIKKSVAEAFLQIK